MLGDSAPRVYFQVTLVEQYSVTCVNMGGESVQVQFDKPAYGTRCLDLARLLQQQCPWVIPAESVIRFIGTDGIGNPAQSLCELGMY